jgi:hypothetical protein
VTRTRSAALLLAVLGVAGLHGVLVDGLDDARRRGERSGVRGGHGAPRRGSGTPLDRRAGDGRWGNADDGTTCSPAGSLARASGRSCDSRGGVDWLMDDSEAPKYRFTTFGRSPAVEVYLDYDKVSGSEALSDLVLAVQQLPATGAACTARPTS